MGIKSGAILLVVISFIFPGIINKNSIYHASNSSYNISLGGSHLLSDNINGVFKQVMDLDKNIKNNFYYSTSKYFNNSYDVIQLGYCLNHNSKKNISFGVIKRSIDNNFETSLSWIEDVDGPSFDEINYSEIDRFMDNELGFLFSYTSKINKNFSFSIKLKPHYHKIHNTEGYGFGTDFILHKNLNGLDFIMGIEDLLAFKKWQSGITENFIPNGYINISKKINNFLLAYEYDNYRRYIYSLDIEVFENIFLRFGYNRINNIVGGFGIKTEFIEFNYAYIDLKNNSNQFSLIFNFKKNETGFF